MGKTDIKSLPLEQLEQWAVEYGEKKFRAKQLYQWMHVKLVDDPEQTVSYTHLTLPTT